MDGFGLFVFHFLSWKPGHKNQLKSKVRRSKSSLFSCGGFLLFFNAFLAVVVNFVCVLASYRQLAKILFHPLFFPFLCLII